jgi:hypothetical protein
MNSAFTRAAFHPNGKPRGWVRSLLFTSDRKARPLFRRVVHKKSGALRPQFAAWVLGVAPIQQSVGDVAKLSGSVTLNEWLRARWSSLEAIPIFPANIEKNRITVVTDSIGSSSLFGGVGTALMLAVQWANRSNADLRIVTRTEQPDSMAFGRLLAANGLQFDGQIEFCRCAVLGGQEISVGRRDLFLSTSWWTTRSLVASVGVKRIVYLLQEDERMFYPYGDDRLECEATLGMDLRKVVINTNLLRNHLTTGSDAVDGLGNRSIAFEPAFASKSRRNPSLGGKRKLFFYARPSNLRNLFATGIAAIGAAVESGAMDPKVWEVHMFGNALPDILFPGGLSVVKHATMGWDSYQAEIAKMDAGFVLMFTPHPSYPPLDLAAIGIPVLTNRCGLKQELSSYSQNILCVAPNMDALVAGFTELTALAEDDERLQANLAADSIGRDWKQAIEPVVVELDKIWKDFD